MRFIYERLEDGTLKITGCEGKAQAVIVPEQIDGQAVTRIGCGAFAALPALASVMIPASIQGIEADVFSPSLRVVILAYQNSPAERYAEKNMMPHVVLTTQDESQIRAIMGRLRTEYVCGAYRYTRSEAGEAIISCYTGRRGGEMLIIPEELDGCRVAGIGKAAFRGLLYERFVLSSGVREIGKAAFEMCFRMESIELPDGLESIGDRAFNCCERLREVYLPSSVKDVGNEAFRACESLERVRFAGRDTQMGYDVFACRRAGIRIEAPEGAAALEYARSHGLGGNG